MIRNNLAALMGERGLKITRVAKETGISRNTITSIAQNDNEMFRMETINTLCRYLGVTPSEFFEYAPIDLDFHVFINDFSCWFDNEFIDYDMTVITIDIDIILDVDKQPKKQSFDLKCTLDSTPKVIDLTKQNAVIDIPILFENEEDKEIFNKETYSQISPSFHQDIYKNLKTAIEDEIIKKCLERLSDNQTFDINQKQAFEEYIKDNLKVELVSDVFKKF